MKVRRTAWVLVFVLASSVFLTARSANAAVDAYLKIDGIQGESTTSKGQWAGWIAVESVSFPAEAVRDAASGMASGKRQHQPFVIMKQIDKASPLLVQACASGKHIPAMQVAYVNAAGQVIKRIEMTDAVILTTRKAGGSPGREMEEIQFTFQKITLQDKAGKTAATDDWLSR